MPARLILASLLALAIMSPAAEAAALPNGGLTAREVADWLKEKGFKASISEASNGDEYVVSAAEGVNFVIDMYDCKGARCASMQYRAGFDGDDNYTVRQMNDWNHNKRWGKADVDDEGDCSIRMDINLSPGGTYEQFADNFAIWTMTLTGFKAHIGF